MSSRDSRSRSRSVEKRRIKRSPSSSKSPARERSKSRNRSDSRDRVAKRSRSRSRGSRRDRSHSGKRSRSVSPTKYKKQRHFGDRQEPERSRCLGVFNLGRRTTEEEFRRIFERYGKLESCKLVYDQKRDESRGFGFVSFHNVEDAADAKKDASGLDINGHEVRIDYSITKRAHSPTPGCYMGSKYDNIRGGRESRGGRGGRGEGKSRGDDRYKGERSRHRSRSPRDRRRRSRSRERYSRRSPSPYRRRSPSPYSSRRSRSR